MTELEKALTKELESYREYEARMLEWQKQGEDALKEASHYGMFKLGGWWADRPWRRK